jgi:hypothetical protein
MRRTGSIEARCYRATSDSQFLTLPSQPHYPGAGAEMYTIVYILAASPRLKLVDLGAKQKDW